MTVVSALRAVSQFEDVYLEHPTVTRRSSVAIVLRFRDEQLNGHTIEEVLAEVESRMIESKAELLFIKRAASDRDRWSSHIALPGGRRDPEDASDVAAAVRETVEEVGLDLTADGIYVGPLDQRHVKISWGTKAIMTLCPFIFILKSPGAEIKIQPTEVATAFWHPLTQILSPNNSSDLYVDIGDRLRLTTLWFMPQWANTIIKKMLGSMVFEAITLRPPYSELIAAKQAAGSSVVPPPYQLWGLTLGYLSDFFELIGPSSRLEQVRMPTISSWDARFFVYVLSYRYVQRTKAAIRTQFSAQGHQAGNMDFVSKLLDGYFIYIRRGIVATLLFRLLAAGALAYRLLRR